MQPVFQQTRNLQQALFSAFQLAAQETGHGLHQLLLRLSQRHVALLQQNHGAAHEISLGQDGRGHTQIIPLHLVADPDPAVAGLIAVGLALLHDLLQLLGIALVHQIPLGCSGHGDDAVPVGDRGDMAGVLHNGLADLRSQLRQVSHGGVFLEDHFSIPLRIDLQRVALADTEGAADFLGNDHPAQIIPLCQERDKKINDFFKKPGAAWFLSFLKR